MVEATCWQPASIGKPFIDFNTRKRKEAANSFEKYLFKLLNDAVYGKSLEKVRKPIDFQIVSKTFASETRFHDQAEEKDLVGLLLRRKLTVLSRPVYVGFAVLHISNAIMYNFIFVMLLPSMVHA